MGNCKDCAEKHEKTGVETIPYIVHEAEMARYERREKRHIIAIIVAVAALFLSNLIWLWCWMQYDYSVETITVDSKDGGNASYIGQDGDIYNGDGYSNEETANAEDGQ